MSGGVELDVSTLLAKIARLRAAIPAAAGAGLYRLAENTMTKAKEQTPVATGTLRASGTVKQPVVEGFLVSVELGFGGAAEKYAIYVHERTELRHPSGNAKFLETPVNEAEASIGHVLGGPLGEAMMKAWGG